MIIIQKKRTSDFFTSYDILILKMRSCEIVESPLFSASASSIRRGEGLVGLFSRGFERDSPAVERSVAPREPYHQERSHRSPQEEPAHDPQAEAEPSRVESVATGDEFLEPTGKQTSNNCPLRVIRRVGMIVSSRRVMDCVDEGGSSIWISTPQISLTRRSLGGWIDRRR